MAIRKWLFVPDTHAPYHDQRAWNLLIKLGQAVKPYGIAHLGDLGDFYKVSAHSKDSSRELTLAQEMDVAKSLRGELDALEPKKKKFCEGNHEFRLAAYVDRLAPEIAPFVSFDDALGLTENGWEVTGYRDYTNIGKLNLTHDTGQGGKYTAARATETFQASVAIGHHHAMQFFVTGDARGDRQLGVSFGWLGDLAQADYMHRIKKTVAWTLGAGVGYHDTRTDNVYVTPIPFIDYQAMWEGRLYRAARVR